MAITNTLKMQYRIVKIDGNENFPCQGVVGKYRAVPVVTQTLTQKGLVNHLAQHQATFRKGVYAQVMNELVECMLELIFQGVAVKLDGLGIFRPTFETKPAASAEDFNLAENLEGVHIRLIPEATKENNLSAKQLMKKISFQKWNDLDHPTGAVEEEEDDEP